MKIVTVTMLILIKFAVSVPYRERIPNHTPSYDANSNQGPDSWPSKGKNGGPGRKSEGYSDTGTQNALPENPATESHEMHRSQEKKDKDDGIITIIGNGEGDYEQENRSGDDDDYDDYVPQSNNDLRPNNPVPGFKRECSSYFDCDFAVPFSNTTRKREYYESTWFNCNGKYCVCELFGIVQYAPFRVSWSKKEKQCMSEEGGPCGRHDGLEIHCAAGFNCKDGMCEDPKKTTTTTAKPPTPCCNGGKPCDNEQVNPFAVLFFSKNVFNTVINSTIKDISDIKDN